MRPDQAAKLMLTGAVIVFVMLVSFNLGRMTVTKYCEQQWSYQPPDARR